MKLKAILSAAVLALLITTTLTASSGRLSDEQAKQAFARLKSLTGEWQTTNDKGTSTLVFTVTGGGTAVVEHFTNPALPDNGDMTTVYSLNGGQLELTHYCMARNQPHMRASSYDPRSGELQFDFVDAGNLASAADGHMHTAHFRFIDDQHFASAWQFYQDGKPKMNESFEFTRVK